MDPDRGLVGIGADQEADDDEPAGRSRDRVDVLDVLDLVEQFLQRGDDAVLDLFGGGAGEADHDVDHGHLDLRLLLGRGDEDGEAAEQQRSDDDQRRQLGLEEGAADAAGNPELAPRHLEAQRLATRLFELLRRGLSLAAERWCRGCRRSSRHLQRGAVGNRRQEIDGDLVALVETGEDLDPAVAEIDAGGDRTGAGGAVVGADHDELETTAAVDRRRRSEEAIAGIAGDGGPAAETRWRPGVLRDRP